VKANNLIYYHIVTLGNSKLFMNLYNKFTV